MLSKTRVNQVTLGNGLKIIVKEDHRAPAVIFQIFYKVGSSFETDGITGISHALEHMMFRGTHLHSSDYFLQTIAGYGGQQNAHTTHDYTSYYEIMPASKLSYCFKFESDRMSTLLLRAQDFAKEIKVVMEERRMMIEDNPERLALENFNAIAYVNSPYRHPIIGWMNDIESLTIQDLRRWYKRWYAPNNAVIVIVGDVNLIQVKRLAKRFFGKIKPSSLPIIKLHTTIKELCSRSALIKTKARLPWFIIGFEVPVVITALEKWEPYALLCLCKILAEGSSARLQRSLIYEKANAIDVSFHYSPFRRLDTVLALTATPMPGHTIDEVRNEILSAIEVLRDQDVSLMELDRVKTNIISNKIYESDSISHQAHEIGSFEAIGLPWQYIDHAYELFNDITLEQIKAVAQRYLNPDNLIFVEFNPEIK